MKIEIEITEEEIQHLSNLWDYLYANYQVSDKLDGLVSWMNIVYYIIMIYREKGKKDEN